MKRLMIIPALALLGLAAFLFAQDLTEDPDFQKALELQALADQAYEQGDYDKAYEYSAQADELLKNLGLETEQDRLKRQADALIKALDERFTRLDSARAEKEQPDKLTTAKTRYENAKRDFSAEDYRQSVNEAQAARQALDELDSLLALNTATPTPGPTTGPTPEPTMEPTPQPTTGPVFTVEDIVLPRYYVVRLIPVDRDCLSKIAGYPFVYNDRTKWEVLYQANKNKLVRPDNPHLIFPRQVLEIPALVGEKREGTYDPAKTYPALPVQP